MQPLVLTIDGPSGSGKTSLSEQLTESLSGLGRATVLVHLDDLYPGWAGLDAGVDRLVEGVLHPWCHGAPEVHLARWDWQNHRNGPVQTVAVPDDDPVLIVEGVGAGARRAARYSSLLIWCDAPTALRKERALRRDGATFAAHWDQWALQEAQHFGRERTRQRADLLWHTLGET